MAEENLLRHQPTAIYRAPLGLLDFLGTKAVGLNPDRLQDVVVGTLDLSPFYIANLQQTVASNTATLNTLGTDTELFRVPQGQIWMIRALYCETLATPGATAVGVAWIAAPGGGIVFTTNYVGTASSPTVQHTGSSLFPQPFIAPTDFSFGVSLAALSVTVDIDIQFRMLYCPVTI